MLCHYSNRKNPCVENSNIYLLCAVLCSVVSDFLQARILFDCHFLLQASPNPGIEVASLALADGFFSTEPPGKPFNDALPMK